MPAQDPAVAPDRFGLIIGAMKCGTTSLFNYLAGHPEIAPSEPKEPNYFCGEHFDPDDLGGFYRLWRWQPGLHRIAMEASVNYTKLPGMPNCAERIARCKGLDVRFVYSMRNPVDRLTSHVYHGVHQGWVQPLEQGVSEHAINVSRYAMQLDPYVSLFGRERILLVVLEEFEKAPAEQLRRICEFFEVDPEAPLSGLDVSHNPASGHFVEHPLWTRLREVPAVAALARLVPSGLRRSLQRSTGQRLEVRRELTAQERAHVLHELTPDLLRLRDQYGIDAGETWGIELG